MPKKGQLDPNASKRSKQQRKFNKKPHIKKQRARNNQANREAKREGRITTGDGNDVAHSKPGARGSTKIQSASANRSFARNKDASRKTKRKNVKRG